MGILPKAKWEGYKPPTEKDILIRERFNIYKDYPNAKKVFSDFGSLRHIILVNDNLELQINEFYFYLLTWTQNEAIQTHSSSYSFKQCQRILEKFK